LKKVRKVVKLFRKSTVKNEVLQKYVVAEQKKELSLVLDCKTRWSFMFEMIHRFLLLKRCIIKALLDLSAAIDVSETEFTFLEDLKCFLEPVKLAVEAWCRRDATLLTAEQSCGVVRSRRLLGGVGVGFFCPTPTPDAQLDHFLHYTLKLGIPVEMLQFFLKLLLNQRFLAVYHDFHRC